MKKSTIPVIALGVFVVAALTVAVFASKGDDKKEAAGSSTSTTIDPNKPVCGAAKIPQILDPLPAVTIPSSAAVDPLDQPAPTTRGAALDTYTGSESDDAKCETAPTVRGVGFDGDPVTISADGHPRVVVFVAHWCPHCQREVPVIAKYLNDGKAPTGVQVTAVSTGMNKAAPNYPPNQWLAKEGWSRPVLVDSDGSTAKAFGLDGYPYFVALDSSGRVVQRASGEIGIDAFDALLKAAIAADATAAA